MRFLIAIFTFLVCGDLFGQVEIDLRERLALSGGKSSEVIGSRILVDADSDLKIEKAVIVRVKTDFKFVRLKARRNGEKTTAEALSASEWLFTGEGKYGVEVIAFDPEKGIEEGEVEFTIGAGPKPPEPPEPGPDPDPIKPDDQNEPFENLAKRVAAVAAGIEVSERAKYNAAIREVIRKMKALEIKRIEEARAFIDAQKLPNNKLNDLLTADAKARGSLSFRDAVLWFEEVERGTR